MDKPKITQEQLARLRKLHEHFSSLNEDISVQQGAGDSWPYYHPVYNVPTGSFQNWVFFWFQEHFKSFSDVPERFEEVFGIDVDDLNAEAFHDFENPSEAFGTEEWRQPPSKVLEAILGDLGSLYEVVA